MDERTVVQDGPVPAVLAVVVEELQAAVRGLADHQPLAERRTSDGRVCRGGGGERRKRRKTNGASPDTTDKRGGKRGVACHGALRDP